MGCGASNSAGKGKTRGAGKNEEPELNGKVKFLSCPSVCEVTHTESKHRYFLIAFAPQTHHGLIIAARNINTGKLLAKEVPDNELVKEKEMQGITLSWNLFFKAISTEIAKANKTGAKYEFTPSGSMKLEIKISIAGAQTNKKVDCYTAELKPVETTDTNLYRLIWEPIATFYCKKRTDLLDRPDPVKERQYGECESNAIIRSASIAQAQEAIAATVPTLGPRREENRKLSQEAFEKRAKLTLMRTMLKEKTLSPAMLTQGQLDTLKPPEHPDAKENSFSLSFLSHVDTYASNGGLVSVSTRAALDDNSLASTEAAIVGLKPIQLSDVKSEPLSIPPLEADIGNDKVTAQLKAFDAGEFGTFDGAALSKASGGHAFYLTSLFLFARYGLLTPDVVPGLDTEKLKNFLFVCEQIYKRRALNLPEAEYPSNPYFNDITATHSMQCFHHFMSQGGMLQQLYLTDKVELYYLVLAAVVKDLDHPGVNNAFLLQSKSFLGTLYNGKSPLEHHHVAVAIQLANQPACEIPLGSKGAATLLQYLISTDMGHHGDSFNAFKARAAQISDWARLPEDRLMCGGAILKASDFFYLYLKGPAYQEWCSAVRGEFHRQGDLHKDHPGLSDVTVQPTMRREAPGGLDAWQRGHNTYGYYVVLPVITTMAKLAPALAPLLAACTENVN